MELGNLYFSSMLLWVLCTISRSLNNERPTALFICGTWEAKNIFSFWAEVAAGSKKGWGTICPCQSQGKEATGLGVEHGMQGPSKVGEEVKKAACNQDAEMLRRTYTFSAWQTSNTVELLMVLFSNAICGSLIKCQIIEMIFLRRSLPYNDLTSYVSLSYLDRHTKNFFRK